VPQLDQLAAHRQALLPLDGGEDHGVGEGDAGRPGHRGPW
jgi:hypothetical protein